MSSISVVHASHIRLSPDHSFNGSQFWFGSLFFTLVIIDFLWDNRASINDYFDWNAVYFTSSSLLCYLFFLARFANLRLYKFRMNLINL